MEFWSSRTHRRNDICMSMKYDYEERLELSTTRVWQTKEKGGISDVGYGVPNVLMN
jgi:hypothetical protein